MEMAEKEFSGMNYGQFKTAVADVVVDAIIPVQKRFMELSKDKGYVDSIIKTNAEKASYLANKTLRKVQKKVGFPVKI